jgi:hypothetical protein
MTDPAARRQAPVSGQSDPQRDGLQDQSAAGSSTPTWRRLSAILLVALAPVILIITAARWRSGLPDPLPTHWSGHWPDGFTSYAGFTAILVGISVVAAAAASITPALRKLAPVYRRHAVTIAGAVAWLAAGLWLSTAGAAWDASDATKVPISWWPTFAIAAMLLGALAVWFAYGRTPLPPHRALDTAEFPVADLRIDGRAVWTRRASAPMFYVLAGVVALLTPVPWLVGAPAVVGVLLLVTAALVAALGSIRVVVDQRGLIVRGGVFGYPRKTVALADVEAASAAIIHPLEWGGWGYRVMPGRSAVVLHKGPGIVLDLANGRQFAVTVGDPQTGAAVLNALRQLDRRGTRDDSTDR